MRTGKLAGLLCSSGWNLLYTVPKGEHGVISVTFASTDGTPITFQVRHVKQGNNDTITHAEKDTITTSYTISTQTYSIVDLGVDSLDDIWVTADVADKLVASVHTEGKEYKHGASQ